ncbi:MAG TPA: hypothetical protein VEU96_22890 [Bryobacteraceae bacterium]|nr:hypothetical protein [Bryobacteraceae bacterium]
MTDLQLYFAVGIPTFAVLIGMLSNLVQHNSTNARISNFENRIDTRLSNMETRIDARFNSLDVKFDTLTGKVVDVDSRVTRIEAKLGIG